jgi:hypothetical protein
VLSATAYSFLHRTRLPRSTWEKAVGLVIDNSGASASFLQRELPLGSFRTAWRMAGIIRRALNNVKWPQLSRDVELCDVNLAQRGREPKSIWLAIERRQGGRGLIRGWQASNNLRADLRLIASSLNPGAVVITPSLGLFNELNVLGFHLRREQLGAAAALPGTALMAQAFRDMLKGRRHHGLSPDTLDLYLAEFVFRHNAVALGWRPAEQKRRVLEALSARS